MSWRRAWQPTPVFLPGIKIGLIKKKREREREKKKRETPPEPQNPNAKAEAYHNNKKCD